MARYPRLMPAEPRLFTASVVDSRPVSPSFQRVRVSGPDLASFEWGGADHWFRLFLPQASGGPLRLPTVKGRAWWRSYLSIPADERPHCSNYTVAAYRRVPGGGELDIDVVRHQHDGELGGAVARWAVAAEPGSPVGLLDQGRLFDPPADASEYHLAADETGLPALRGILRDLPADATGVAYLEVPVTGDVARLRAPEGVRVYWLPRDASGVADGRVTPGGLALAALGAAVPRPDGYAFVVGESGLATGGRRALRSAGLAASRITFSGYWKA